ncbi:MAG: glycerol-3-phosphate acyltransferase, partial [Halioglobus sp.]|nr:glycerol-3-phosphate acyltransferase [Halioglobus sp.]
MSSTPWPVSHDGPLVFILDAAHRVDEGLLRDWVDGNNPASAGQAQTVVVPIVRDPENIPGGALLAAVDAPEDTLFVPLRVVWKSSVDAKTGSPRLRDLIWGNPRRPNATRAGRILRSHPERVETIAAEPATLGEMKQRYLQRRGESPTTPQLADYVAAQAGLALDIAERKLRGSRYKVPRQVARNLQARPQFKAALQEISRDTGRSVPELERESAEIMQELISIPQTFWIDMMGVFNRYLINLGYETDMVIDRQSLDRVRQ